MFILLFRDVPVCSVVLSLRFVFVGRPLFFFPPKPTYVRI